MIRICLYLLPLLCLLYAPVWAEASNQPFADVPADHWAAGAVKQMAELGIVKGYPGGGFKGDKPVTRYELAVVLDRLVQSIERGLAPAKPGKQAKREQARPSPKTPQSPWSRAVKPSLNRLVSGGYIPKDSPLLNTGNAPVKQDLLARSLASVTARLAVQAADREAAKDEARPAPTVQTGKGRRPGTQPE